MPSGGLDRLHDKVVGIIGTGATAVQCVPHLGAAAKQLFVFQRTPVSIDVRNDRPTDPRVGSEPGTGLATRRMDNFNNLVSGIPEAEDLVNDGWTDIIGNLLVRLRQGAGRDDPRRHRAHDGAGRLREDGADPRPRRRDRAGPGDGRGAEAVVSPVLQAAVLPRRLPAHVQPTQRHARGHRRQGRRADHRARRRGERHRVPARLPDLRHRFRGGHRLRPPCGLRGARSRRHHAHREVGRRRLHVPRLLHAAASPTASSSASCSRGSR